MLERLNGKSGKQNKISAISENGLDFFIVVVLKEDLYGTASIQ